MNYLAAFNQKLREAKKLPAVTPGDTVRVYQRIKESSKTRLQVFEGIVMARQHGSEPGATITVRKMSGGIGVEKIFPLYLPTVEKIEVVRKTKVRRAKLYYLRRKSAKETRRKLRVHESKSPAPLTSGSSSSENKAVESKKE